MIKKKRNTSILHKLWQVLPETQLKNQLRAMLYNVKARGEIRYSLQRSIYTSHLHGVKLHTHEQPFGLVRHLAYYLHRYQPQVGDTIIDAGAWNGHVSLYLAQRVGSTGRVVAIEPDGANRYKLQKNIALNPECTNITVLDSFIWNCVEPISFYAQGTVASSAYWAPEGATTTTIEATTIDTLVRSYALSQLNFVKMNIEGAEIKALAGASDTIKRFRPRFAIASNHTVDGELTYLKVEQILRAAAYQVETVFFSPSYCYTYASV